MKILAFALSGIGDALMFSPAIRLLKQYKPNCEIDILAMYKGVKEIYETNPFVNKVIYFDFLKEGYIKSLKFLLSLRKKYDVSINVYPSNRKEYNIISFLVGAKIRLAVKYKFLDFSNLGFLNNLRIEESILNHNVETNVLMISKLLNLASEQLPPLDLFISEDIEKKAEEYFSSLKVPNSTFIFGFHPGCSTLKNHINRRWSPDYFAELINLIDKNYDAIFFLFGGPDEIELRSYIKKKSNSNRVYIINANSFLETAALIKKCDVFITNDSGLMHAAAAVKAKVLPIIGPTNLHFIKPWRTTFEAATLNLECSPCFFYSPKPLNCKRNDIKYKCVKELTPNFVFNKFKILLDHNIANK